MQINNCFGTVGECFVDSIDIGFSGPLLLVYIRFAHPHSNRPRNNLCLILKQMKVSGGRYFYFNGKYYFYKKQ